jgi:starch-binding outer membrane protein, SusD/RagB family
MQQWHCGKRIILVLLASSGFLLSCNKNNFLDKKPSSDLVIPSTLQDFQGLLDNDLVMQETPELGELSTDDFYMTYSAWSGTSITTKEHNAYAWDKDIYERQGGVEDWDDPYQQIFYANIVLEGLSRIAIDSSNKLTWKNLEGSAYFIRAYAFYNLAQVFAPVYGPDASTTLGIPLRTSSAIKQVSTRATVQTTYDTIILELKAASSLLPRGRDSSHLNRPSKLAALAMLARVYLSMGDYLHAGLYADSCLKMYDTLIDYNTVSQGTFLPFAKTNAETIYQSCLLSSSGVLAVFLYPGTIVDSNLYQSYADSDLRKSIFFTTGGNMKGNYNGSIHPFSGLATDEVYLIRAECFAQAGDSTAALNDLNSLLVKRWAQGSFPGYTTPTVTGVLDSVLAERRKELVFRGLRWTDLRRLNGAGAKITLTRYINGQDSILKPNSQRYVLPIPPDVVGIVQNLR